MLDSAGLVKHARVRGDDRKLKHFEQSLLRHFLGVFAVAAHQPTIVKNRGAEVFHKAVKPFWFHTGLHACSSALAGFSFLVEDPPEGWLKRGLLVAAGDQEEFILD